MDDFIKQRIIAQRQRLKEGAPVVYRKFANKKLHSLPESTDGKTYPPRHMGQPIDCPACNVNNESEVVKGPATSDNKSVQLRQQ